MFTVYVLHSERSGKRYVGYTSKSASQRLQEHNSGTNTWTRQNGPFVLVYAETYTSGVEARIRERFLKSGQGRKFLDERLKSS